ncbi:response regulator [Sorangium sp. So ce131]|uniref:response regulator n=1 Tax=Sorangium sp. So ce131 TaxID=3133282 RepID=UPI003F5D919C
MPERSILIVDDDRDLRFSVAQLLEDEGYRVNEAENGRQALHVLRSAPLPDLVLLDLMMPIMSGQEFRAEQLRDPALARVPVALMTAGRIEDRLCALTPAAVIRKPIAADELLSIIEGIVA